MPIDEARIRLENFEQFQRLFSQQTPGSPDWFEIIDTAVGILLADRADALRAAADSAT